MVPLINNKSDAQEAVSHCLYPPSGPTLVCVLCVQVETRACFEALDEVLSLPRITVCL